jgi:4-amino-4-deoxy-L-arabinose transferase-like glycosyltransferase
MTAKSTSTEARLAHSSAGVSWQRLLVLLALAAGLKLGLAVLDVVPFNADEAVVGLMARHILQGERPVFFYGQAYLGSLDAWLVAGAFLVFGQTVLAIRLVQLALYLGTVATTYALGLKIYRSQWLAGAAALFMVVAPVLVTLYTTVSLGGYDEALLFGNVILWLGLDLLQQPVAGGGPQRWAGRRYWVGWVLLGFVTGLAFWTFPITLAYVLPVLVYMGVALRQRRGTLLAASGMLILGFGLGASPWLVYTLMQGSITVAEMTGQAIRGASSPLLLLALYEHLFNFLLFGPTVVWGLRPPWSAEFLALALVPYALAVHVGAIIVVARRLINRRGRAAAGRWLLAGTLLCTIAAFVLSPFGADPSGRYFLPLAVPVALFTAEMLHWFRLRRRQKTRRSLWRKWFGQLLALGLVAFYWWGNVQAATDYPPGFTTQFDAVTRVDVRALPDLIQFLRANGETRGYTNYWVEYPLAFASQEELIYVARLPYHQDFRYTARDSRLPAYETMVAASERVAYITTRHPELDSQLRSGLGSLGVEFSERTFGDYHVYYGLSRRVTPDEFSFGLDCCAP